MRLRLSFLNLSLVKFLPFLRWGKKLDKETVKIDFVAGLTSATLVLPQGVAFAIIAGMPPEYGLYASIVPAIIAALFGSSWHLISGPTTAASIVMFSSLSTLAIPGSPEYISLAITLAFMVGVTQFAMGLFRMGTLVNFISHSVIVGFTAGAALLIASKQLKIFLGLDIPEQAYWLQTLPYLWQNWNAFHPMVVVVSLCTITITLLVRLKYPKLPGMVIALIFGSLVAAALNAISGAANTGIEMVGALPQRLPPLSMPNFSLSVLQELAPLALAMTLFALTEAVSIARSIALKTGQSIQGNQEFFGQGLSNIIGSFFSAYVATGSFNRSSANYEAGARTPLAAILGGLLLIPLILLVAPLTAYLPKASVAALLILVAWQIIDFVQIKKLFTADPRESAIMAVTFLTTIFFKLEFAIIFGVILSLMLYLRKTSRPSLLPRVPDAQSASRKFTTGVTLAECPQVKILRLEDSIYFGSVTHVGDMFRLYREHYPEQKHLLLLTKGVNQVDVAGAELLRSEASERRKMNGDLYMYRLKESASKVLKNGGYLDYIGEHNIFDSKHQAIEEIFEKLDRDICATCSSRIFLECKAIPMPIPVAIPAAEVSNTQTDTINTPEAKKVASSKAAKKKSTKKTSPTKTSTTKTSPTKTSSTKTSKKKKMSAKTVASKTAKKVLKKPTKVSK